ncbi:MAG: cytochrome c maturation protein CcmE [Hyphomicrobiales bacterium]|nr:cytochrome c maturation protein CcmE [Hyphomicrobiales bacterium]
MTRKQRRLALIFGAMTVLGASTALVLSALNDSVVYFISPTDAATKAQEGQRFRLGGLVQEGSVARAGTRLSFAVTDTKSAIPVVYEGVVPDLFREGQGVVAEGKLNANRVFVADTVLAKHDENYMPPEVAEALKRQGVFRPGGDAGRETAPAADKGGGS